MLLILKQNLKMMTILALCSKCLWFIMEKVLTDAQRFGKRSGGTLNMEPIKYNRRITLIHIINHIGPKNNSTINF